MSELIKILGIHGTDAHLHPCEMEEPPTPEKMKQKEKIRNEVLDDPNDNILYCCRKGQSG